MTKAEKQRQKAIQLYRSGRKVSSICREFDKSRKWFYKWHKHFKTGNPDWYKNKSKAPNNTPGTEETTVNLIIQIRKELMDKKYAHIGAQAIDWELSRMGINPPSHSTINRIIKSHDLITRKSKYQKKGTPYPKLPVWFPNTLHQVDFWGPRYIKGDGRAYSFNVIDVYTRRVLNHPARNKSKEEALKGLIKAWELLGPPDFIQLDNAMTFRGSPRYPRLFGLVIKWCLQNGIQPIFIPLSEPWRNGYIEKFHDSLEKKFFRQITFTDYQHYCCELKYFNEYHNQNYRYSPLGGLTPNEVYQKDRLSYEHTQDYEMPTDFTLSEGNIHLIRFIRSNLKLNIFGEEFDVPKELEYEYVVATICLRDHVIRVYDSQRKSLFTLPYRIPIK